jgi:fermentation-respiration switch protein FrsA (DUF1100 family)
MIRRRMLTVLVALVVAGIALAVAVRAFEPRFAFLPMSGVSETPAGFGVPYESVTLTTDDGERLRAWLLPHPAPRAEVLYFHGNGGNLSVWAPILAGVHRRGYTVRAIDYRGYGESSGTPTERGLYRDVNAAVNWAPASARVPIVYWGRSLGVSMAAYAATIRLPDALILESGFPDARTLLRAYPVLAFLSLFSTYRFATTEHLRRVQAPVLVVHGDADRVVPFENGRALFAAIEGPKEFFTIQGGDHNDRAPRDAERYWETIDRFIASAQ